MATLAGQSMQRSRSTSRITPDGYSRLAGRMRSTSATLAGRTSAIVRTTRTTERPPPTGAAPGPRTLRDATWGACRRSGRRAVGACAACAGQCRPFSAGVTVSRCRLVSPLENGQSRSAYSTRSASWSRLSPAEEISACTSARYRPSSSRPSFASARYLHGVRLVGDLPGRLHRRVVQAGGEGGGQQLFRGQPGAVRRQRRRQRGGEPAVVGAYVTALGGRGGLSQPGTRSGIAFLPSLTRPATRPRRPAKRAPAASGQRPAGQVRTRRPAATASVASAAARSVHGDIGGRPLRVVADRHRHVHPGVHRLGQQQRGHQAGRPLRRVVGEAGAAQVGDLRRAARRSRAAAPVAAGGVRRAVRVAVPRRYGRRPVRQ